MTELREPPLLSDETLFMSFYHDGYNPEEEGADVERFMKSRDGQRAIEIAERQRFEDILWMKEHCYLKAERELPKNSSYSNFEETYGRRPKDIVFAMGQQFKEQDMLKEGFKAVEEFKD